MIQDRRLLLVRLPVAAALALLLALLVSEATLVRALPVGDPLRTSFLVLLVLVALPAFGEARPLPAWLAVAASALGLALYGSSNLDWTLLAVDAGLAPGGVPSPFVLAASAAPFALAFGAASVEERLRAVAHYRAKGVAPDEAASAARDAPSVAVRALLVAGGAWVLVVLAFLALRAAAPALRPAASAAPALVPVAIAALVGVALARLLRRS